ncbi:MAG: rod shape-determining protein MreD [Armatimonadota bacterium]
MMYDRIRPSWIARVALWQGWGATLRVGLLLWVLAVLQGVLAPAIAIRGIMPDLLLLALGCLALRLNPSAAATAGFFAGLLHASMLDQTLGSLILSRTLTAFLVAWLPTLLDRQRLLSACFACALTVLLANGLLYLAAPSLAGWNWWWATGGIMVYNTLLAAPAYWLIRRMLPYQEEIA